MTRALYVLGLVTGIGGVTAIDTTGVSLEKTRAATAPLPISTEVHDRPVERLAIVNSSIRLAVTAERLISQHYRERRLHTQVEKLGNGYDYILLDCPPNLGVITVNAIYTADWVLIPTTYGRYSLDGIADLFASIEEIREGKRDCWILRNAFDSRTSATNEYIRQLKN